MYVCMHTYIYIYIYIYIARRRLSAGPMSALRSLDNISVYPSSRKHRAIKQADDRSSCAQAGSTVRGIVIKLGHRVAAAGWLVCCSAVPAWLFLLSYPR